MKTIIERVKSDEFWDEITVGELEEIRDQLRGIVQFRRKDEVAKLDPIIIDVKEDEADIERKKHKVRLDKLDDLEMVAYRNRVNNVLQAIIDQERYATEDSPRRTRQRERSRRPLLAGADAGTGARSAQPDGLLPTGRITGRIT